MPFGPNQISWTAENDKKLLLAIIAVHQIKVDSTAVSKHFGANISAQAIRHRLSRLRTQAGIIGATPGISPGVAAEDGEPAPAKKSAARAPSAAKPKAKKRKAGGILNNDASDDDDEDTAVDSDIDHDKKRARTGAATPSRQMSIAGTITKPRASPRGLAKKDYKALENPHAGDAMMDEDGNPIFEEEAEEEEDSADEYQKAARTEIVQARIRDIEAELDAPVKMEGEQDAF